MLRFDTLSNHSAVPFQSVSSSHYWGGIVPSCAFRIGVNERQEEVSAKESKKKFWLYEWRKWMERNALGIEIVSTWGMIREWRASLSQSLLRDLKNGYHMSERDEIASHWAFCSSLVFASRSLFRWPRTASSARTFCCNRQFARSLAPSSRSRQSTWERGKLLIAYEPNA